MTQTTLRYRATGMYGIGKPGAVTGRPYVGFAADDDYFYAWRYAGGTYVEELARITRPDTESLANIVTLVSPAAPLVAVFQSGDQARFYVVNVSTGSAVTIDRSGSLHGGDPIEVGFALTGPGGSGVFYWIESRRNDAQFWLMRGGMGGGATQITEEADGQLDHPTAFASDFGGFYSRNDEAVILPNWGGGTESESGYILLPLNGDAPSRVVDLDWLPFDVDRSEWAAYWESGYGTAGGKALVNFDGPGPERVIYKVDLDGPVVIVGAAHSLPTVLSYSESPGSELVLYVNDAGTRQVARVPSVGIEDPPTGEITWTAVEEGPQGFPIAMFALD